MFLVRRLALAIAVVVIVAVVAYGMVRALQPDIYGSEELLPGLASDLCLPKVANERVPRAGELSRGRPKNRSSSRFGGIWS